MSQGYFAAISGGSVAEEMEMMWEDHEFRLANPDLDAISREVELTWLDLDQRRTDDEWATQPKELTELEIVWGRIAITASDMLESKLILGEEIDVHSIAVDSAMSNGVDFNYPNIVIDSEGNRHYDTTVVGLTAIRIKKILSGYCNQPTSAGRLHENIGDEIPSEFAVTWPEDEESTEDAKSARLERPMKEIEHRAGFHPLLPGDKPQGWWPE